MAAFFGQLAGAVVALGVAAPAQQSPLNQHIDVPQHRKDSANFEQSVLRNVMQNLTLVGVNEEAKSSNYDNIHLSPGIDVDNLLTNLAPLVAVDLAPVIVAVSKDLLAPLTQGASMSSSIMMYEKNEKTETVVHGKKYHLVVCFKGAAWQYSASAWGKFRLKYDAIKSSESWYIRLYVEQPPRPTLQPVRTPAALGRWEDDWSDTDEDNSRRARRAGSNSGAAFLARYDRRGGR